MRILFLGYEENQIIDFLSEENEITVWNKKINIDFVNKFDYLISYGYRHIIKKEVIQASKNEIINLHKQKNN